MWLYFLIKEIESEYEELDAIMKLTEYIDQAKTVDNISKACLEFTESFFTGSFEKHMFRMCQRHYMEQWFGWVAETSFVESSNKSLEYSAVAPKVTDCLHRAGDKIIQHTYETHQKKIRQ